MLCFGSFGISENLRLFSTRNPLQLLRLFDSFQKYPYFEGSFLSMSHTSRVTYESCHTWVMSHMSHITHESCHTWVMTHMSHVSPESCQERRKKECHVTHELCAEFQKNLSFRFRKWKSQIPWYKLKSEQIYYLNLYCEIQGNLRFAFWFPSGPLVPMLLKILPQISIFSKMQISDFPVSRSTNSNSRFVLISICTDDSEFSTVAIFWGVAFPVESVTLEPAVILRIILFCFWF